MSLRAYYRQLLEGGIIKGSDFSLDPLHFLCGQAYFLFRLKTGANKVQGLEAGKAVYYERGRTSREFRSGENIILIILY